jgi:integral membrane sensor domain MASE1
MLWAAGVAWPLALYWHLPILIVVISLVYSATRFESWGAILREAFRWGLRMTAFLCSIAAALYVLSLFI